ncbi:hypothetical protein DAMA08_026220 [Martiniozyma asiatica (nom. inval.)]|nr:hypothetical protein DAMA08_026220 [Martiniozyma asiatica]
MKISILESSIGGGKANIIFGCTVGVLSSACQSIGLILQRKSHLMCEYSKNHGLIISNYDRSLWHIGFFMFLIANLVGSSIQITSLPIIVLTPLQSIGLVFNTIFHSLILNETFTNCSLYGTILISFGAFFIAYCGGKISEPSYDLPTFISLLKNDQFINWIVFNLLVILILLILILFLKFEIEFQYMTAKKLFLKNKLQILQFNIIRHNESISNVGFNYYFQLYTYNSITLLIKCLIKFINLMFKHRVENLKRISGIFLGIISGILSSHSLLLAKSAIEILISTFINHNWKNLNSMATYIIVIIFILLGLSQLYLLNKGLKKISTSILYPLVFCVYNVFSISNSLIFFNQWSQITPFTFMLILMGSLLVIAGVFILSSQSNHNDLSNDRNLMGKSRANTLADFDSGDCTYDQESGNSISVDAELGSCCNTHLLNNNNFNKRYNGINSQSSDQFDNSIDNYSFGDSIQSDDNINNNYLITPIIKRTTENLNSAGRKVSGIFKKSMDSFHQGDSIDKIKNKVNLDNNNNNNSNSNNNNDLKGYISFDSLKGNINLHNNNNNNNNNQSNNSINCSNNSSNLAGPNKYESLSQVETNMALQIPLPNESNSTVGGLFQPIIGKIKGQSNNIDIHSHYDNNNNNQLTSFLPESLTSNISFGGLKNFIGKDEGRRGNLLKLPINTSNNPAENSEADTDVDIHDVDDYNPNNNFNYSFSNTLDEINQHLESSEHMYNSNEVLKTPSKSKSKSKSKLAPKSWSNLNTNTNTNTNTKLVSPLLKKHNKHRRIFTTDNLVGDLSEPVRMHQRVMSFEQQELLNELHGRF